MTEPPVVDRPLQIESPVETVRNELRWSARTRDGDAVLLAQLLPELAQDESLRRRYVYEAERLAAVNNPSLAEVLAVGPLPDPRSPQADAPWRLRREPSGVRLDRWLLARAPVPIDEGIDLLSRLAEAVHSLHDSGLVLRDLEPRSIVLGEDKAVTITDVGLARVDILSSRTASSLMLESSAYAAPEHLRATVVDARADVYTLGAIAWQALCGVLPYDEGSPFLRDYGSLPDLQELRAEVPDGLDSLLRACLSEDPDARPRSAQQLARILQGGSEPGARSLERVRCQACGHELRLGLRLCLQCGKTAVQYHRSGDEPGYSISLQKAKEDREFHSRLQRFFEDVGEGPPPQLNFLIGDARMYSKAERKSRTQLPVQLLGGLAKGSAEALTKRLEEEGFKVKLKKGQPTAKRARYGNRLMAGGATFGGILTVLSAVSSFLPLAIAGIAVGGAFVAAGAIVRYRARRDETPSLAQLRAGPTALPASDPYVAAVAALLRQDMAADLREQVSELALLVQRLCDHRAQSADTDGALEMLLAPLSSLVALLCEEVESIRSIDSELGELDEGNLMRAIAASEARDEPRTRRSHFLDGLDRLRDLENERASHMGALLQAAGLLERTVTLSLSETDGRLLESNRITMALAALASD